MKVWVTKVIPGDTNVVVPERQTHGSYGYDLATATPLYIQPGEVVLAPTGLMLAENLPLDTAMFLMPRSSLPLKYGLAVANSPGLIDADYAGEIKVMLHNFSKQIVNLPAGTRIAQLVLARVITDASFVLVDEPNPSRTRGGFGSTGV